MGCYTFSAILSLLAGTVHFPSYPYTVTYIALRPFPKSRGYGAQEAVTVTVWRSPPTFLGRGNDVPELSMLNQDILV